MSGDRGILRGRVLLCGVATIVGLTACAGRPDPNVTLATLEQSLPRMEAWAKDWKDDAALWFVSFYILPEDENLVQEFHPTDPKYRIEPMRRTAARGYFLSPSDFSEVLIISILRDGSIESKVIAGSEPLSGFVPIKDDDWELDSMEAFSIGLTSEGREFLSEHEASQCSSTMLEKLDHSLTKDTIWRIFLRTCEPRDTELFQRTYLDATTGEILSQDTYELSENTPP